MTLEIVLTPEEEDSLRKRARAKGMEAIDFVKELITLPAADNMPEIQPQRDDSEARIARVLQVKGKYAHFDVRSEDLRKERTNDDIRSDRFLGERAR